MFPDQLNYVSLGLEPCDGCDVRRPLIHLHTAGQTGSYAEVLALCSACQRSFGALQIMAAYADAIDDAIRWDARQTVEVRYAIHDHRDGIIGSRGVRESTRYISDPEEFESLACGDWHIVHDEVALGLAFNDALAEYRELVTVADSFTADDLPF